MLPKGVVNSAIGSLVVSLLVARYFLTTTQIVNQFRYMTRWHPFWYGNICIASNCKMTAVDCFSNLKCAQTIGCINTCLLDNIDSEDKVAACAYLCEMTYGYENRQFLEIIDCMLTNKCLLQYPEDGPCIGGNQDAITSVKTMKDIEGDWWVLRGLNCGEGNYPGGYDWYPCQHERFIKSASGQWINNVTYCGGQENKCSTDMIVTIANVSMEVPGVVHHSYTDAPLSPQEEDWRLVSMPHPDYALMLWCGRLPVLDYAGGIVISKHRTDKNMPRDVEKEFRKVLKSHGLDWDKMCPSDNDHCPF